VSEKSTARATFRTGTAEPGLRWMAFNPGASKGGDSAGGTGRQFVAFMMKKADDDRRCSWGMVGGSRRAMIGEAFIGSFGGRCKRVT